MHTRTASVHSTTSRQRRLRRLLALTALLGGCLVGGAIPAAAAAERLPDGVVWTATVNDRNVERTTGDEPVRLDPTRPAEIVVRVENRSDRPVEVGFVRLEGAVLELTFYSYTTQVDLRLPPGAADERTFALRLLDLDAHATGLIPSRIALLDAEGRGLAEKSLTVDVRGDVTSVYGVFGAAIGAVTLLLVAGALWRLGTGRLHPNRWRRALLFAAPGLGLGFVVTFTLSALRVATPEGSLWTSLLLCGGAVGFLAGYLTPTPVRPEDRESDAAGGRADVDEADDTGRTSDEEPAEDPAWPAGPGLTEGADEPREVEDVSVRAG